MKTLWLILGTLFLVALSGLGCGKKGLTLGAGGAVAGGGGASSSQKAQFQDMTKNQCNGQTPKTATVLGSWRRTLATTGGSAQSLGLVITGQNITLTNTCTSNTLRREVSTGTLPIVLTNSKISILAPSNKTGGDLKLACSVSLPQGDTEYKFVGNCLLLNLNGQLQYFIHEEQ